MITAETTETGRAPLLDREAVLHAYSRSRFAYRLRDIILSAAALLFLWPFLAIVALVIWGIVTFMKKMYGGFYKTRMQAEDRLEVEKLKADKWTARGRRKENEGHTENNASRRIRKMYKKNMSKSGEKNLREFPYMTPGEQVQRREETYDFKGDSGEVRELYEKARYGKDAVTDSDVEKMRGIL